MIKKILSLFSFLEKKHKISLLILISLMFLATFFEILSLGMILPLIGSILSNSISDMPLLNLINNYLGNPEQKLLIIYMLSILVSIFILKSIFLIITIYFQFSLSWELQTFFRKKLYSIYLNKDYESHASSSSSVMISRLLSQVDQFTTLFLIPIVLVSLDGLLILSVILFLFYVESVSLISVISIILLISLLIIMLGGKKLKKLGADWKLHDQEITKFIQQSLEGFRETILYKRKYFFLNKIEIHSEGIAKNMKLYLTIQQFPRIILELISIIILSSVILYSILYLNNLNEVILKLGLIAAAAFKILPSANRLIYSLQSLKFGKSTLSSLIDEFGNNKYEIKKIKKNLESLEFFKCIEIKNLCFSYSNKSQNKNFLLNDITFRIIKGDKIGIKGKTGSGKSTFIDLFSGLLSPSKGAIEVDGKNIFGNIEEWRNLLAYVPQNPYLIEDTIKQNIIFGEKNLNLSHLKQVLEMSELTNFIKNCQYGYDTLVGERGVQISGGQKQRIAIARALYKKPEILLLDESVSSLDNFTAEKVVEKIINNTNITILFISHNNASLKFCNKIYNLDKGQLTLEK